MTDTQFSEKVSPVIHGSISSPNLFVSKYRAATDEDLKCSLSVLSWYHKMIGYYIRNEINWTDVREIRRVVDDRLEYFREIEARQLSMGGTGGMGFPRRDHLSAKHEPVPVLHVPKNLG